MNNQRDHSRRPVHIHQGPYEFPGNGSYPMQGYSGYPGSEASFGGGQFVQQPPAAPDPVGGASLFGGAGGAGKAGMLGDLQSLVTRMGGIDGIMSTVGKFQKIVSTVQQLSPMLRLFMKNKASSSDGLVDADDIPRRRRRKRKGRRRRNNRRRGSNVYRGSRYNYRPSGNRRRRQSRYSRNRRTRR